MANILLLTQGTGGDLHPFIQAGIDLKARGHKVTLITNDYFEDEVKRRGLNFAPLLIRAQAKDMQGHRGPRQRDPESLGQSVFDACLYIYDGIKRFCHSGQTILVSHSNLSFTTQMAAEKLKIPYVVVYTAPYFVMRMPFAEQLLNAETDVINSYRARLHLPRIDSWASWLKSPRWKIGLWPEWFAPNDPRWMFKVSPVGFVWNQDFETGEIPEEVRAHSKKGAPLVLITHGTSKPHRPEFFAAAIEACKALGCTGLVVTKHDEVVPNRLSDNIKRYRYLPFASILPIISAMIHHGGIGTLHQTLKAGVPQLVLAYGYDRPDNGARIQRLGGGEWLPAYRWQPDLVTESLRRILAPEVNQRCKDLAARQANTTNPVAAFCDVIESALEQSATATALR
jgi:rhamnosyltransferase subunit B